MRAALLVLALLLAGCALPERPAAAPTLTSTEIVALDAAPRCLARYATFTLTFTIRNPEAQAGEADVRILAQQYGNLVVERVALDAGEERTLTRTASIDTAGRWDIYAAAPASRAPAVQLEVVDPRAGDAC